MSSVLLQIFFPRQSFMDPGKNRTCGPAARDPSQSASGVPLQLLPCWFLITHRVCLQMVLDVSQSRLVALVGEDLICDACEISCQVSAVGSAGRCNFAGSITDSSYRVLTLVRAVKSVNMCQGTGLGDLFTSPVFIESPWSSRSLRGDARVTLPPLIIIHQLRVISEVDI